MLRITSEDISVITEYSETEFYFIPSDISSTLISSLQICEGEYKFLVPIIFHKILINSALFL